MPRDLTPGEIAAQAQKNAQRERVQSEAQRFAHETPQSISLQERTCEQGFLILRRTPKMLRVYWCDRYKNVEAVFECDPAILKPAPVSSALALPPSSRRADALMALISTRSDRQAPGYGQAQTTSVIRVNSNSKRGIKLRRRT